jgi:hypothetical protein
MKCISCETEINPKWEHAIDINVCPFCGKHIMEEHLKNCLTGLSAAMKDMMKYPEQLNDWLLSNHNYIKTDSPNLKNYIPKETIKELRKEIDDEEFQEKKQILTKIKVPDGIGGFTEEEVLVEKVQSAAKTNSFHERAQGNLNKKEKRVKEVVPTGPKSIVEKTQYLKEMAEQIRNEGTAGIINETGLASMISPEMIDNADPEDVANFESMIDSGDIVSSGLPASSDGDDDEIPSSVLAMASRAKKGSGGGANEADMQSLRDMQNKVKNAHKKLESGKGGFSRA